MALNVQPRWEALPLPDSTTTDHLSEVLGVPTWIAQLLAQRGVTTFDQARTFFRPDLAQLLDPFLMQDMDLAVSRLRRAVLDGEHIRVYGDYDVDGTTAVALMTTFLESLDANVDFYIPDRYAEGYGVSAQGIQDAAESGVGLLITLDCGVRATERIAEARSAGIDVIVCDHHKPGDVLPDAVAVLDPNRVDCPYPCKALSGCGVGFKLIEAYTRRTGGDPTTLEPYLDLVAVSIAADIVPITGENRVLMYYGLKQIMEAPRPGIRRLFAVAGHKSREKTVSDIVFTVAPRINAAGRMSSARAAVEILRSEEADKTGELLERIEAWNKDRRAHDRGVFEAAWTTVQADPFYIDAWSTVVWGEDWHKGVVGIAASRLIEHRYRPTLVLTRQGEEYTGSARSIEGLDIHEVLKACSRLLSRYGGHAMAAGATLPAENIEAFREAFDVEVRRHLTEADLVPRIPIALDLELAELDGKSWNVLKQMGPFGPGNMEPIFRAGPLLDAGGSRTIGSDKTHLRVQVCSMDGTGPLLEGVGFGLAEKGKRLLEGEPFYLAFTLQENEWQGRRRLQMMVKDVVYVSDLTS